MRIVVIGGVAAGTKAASRAKRVAPEAEVVIYQAEPDVSISECGMPYFLSGIVGSRERLVARTPEKFEENDIEVRVRHRVEGIDAENKTLVVHDLGSDTTFEDSYDRLIVSTGAKAVVPPIPGSGLDGVFKLRFLTDADDIERYIEEHSPKSAVVVGGGYIGLEMAEALTMRGMEVSLIEAGERLAPTYGSEVARIVNAHLEEKGVKVFAGNPVSEMEMVCEGGDDGCVHNVEFGGEGIGADLVIVAIGVKPEIELAKSAGAEIGETGAIKTDEHMRTNLPEVWAAGDCAETTNYITGGAVWVPLGDTANQMGRVAGTNAAKGEADLAFPGVLGTGIFKVFDLGVGKTGLSESEAEEAGFETLCASVEASNRAGYFPGSAGVFLKMISDKNSGRILGAEAVGASVDKLIDVSATAIWGGLKVGDVVDMDLAYAPPFGPTLSPVIQAATVLSGKLLRSGS
ncbi:MAG: FAD-dependent oxidoreductase [Rubrobacter sp.]|nr:FAD-dependent oxidoreductase [Rubrobacter sp.]